MLGPVWCSNSIFNTNQRVMELEKKFEELEAKRPDFPKGGRRCKPLRARSGKIR